MVEYAFYSIKDDGLISWGVDPLPMPVRKDLEPVVFGSNRVRLGLLVDELRLFLTEFPDLTTLYATTMEAMCLLAGLDSEEEGDLEAAASYLETGLEANPESLLLRSSYAMVLHGQERRAQAGEQYETVLAEPEGWRNPIFCLLATRLYAEQGEYTKACRLLERAAAAFPQEDAFRGFLAEIRALAGLRDQAGAVPSTSCVSCGQALRERDRFCPACGAERVSTAPMPASCSVCGKELYQGLGVCPNCGSPAGGEAPRGNTCTGCGSQLRAGAHFCRICGRPQ